MDRDRTAFEATRADRMVAPLPLPMTASEERALLTLHGLLIEAFTNDPSLRFRWYVALKCDHPDQVCLNFLRMLNLDPEKALGNIITTLHWRRDVHLDEDILANGEPGALAMAASPTAPRDDVAVAEGFLRQFRMGKALTHGHDADGRPITIVRVRLHKGSAQPPAAMERFVLWQIESVRLANASKAFPYPRHAPTSQCTQEQVDAAQAAAAAVHVDSVMMFDLTHFSIGNMDFSPVKFIIDTFERHYPEALGSVIIHHSPWIFEKFWKVIRAWIPDYFTDRVHFSRSVAELDRLVPRDQALREMGGDDAWEYRYTEPTGKARASLDVADSARKSGLEAERASLADQVDQWTCGWLDAAQNDVTAAEKHEVLAQRELAIEQLRRNYWQLDGLVRARGLLDEWGLIKNPLS